MTEVELVTKLKANQESAVAALERNDMAAYEALVFHEAQIMDALRAMWGRR